VFLAVGHGFSTTGSPSSGQTFLVKTLQCSQRPHEKEIAVKERLIRKHGADLSGEEDVQEKGLDHIVLIVGQSDLVTSVFPGQFEEVPAAKPRAEKTGAALRL